MKLSAALEQKASPALLKDLEGQEPDQFLSVIVKLRPLTTGGPKGTTGPSRARSLKKSVAQAGKRALALMRDCKKENPFIYWRPSFLLHGLVVNAPLEIIERLAALDEVIVLQPNRKFELPAPRIHGARSLR